MAVTLDVTQTPQLAIVYQWTPDLPFSEPEFRQMIDEANMELKENGQGVKCKCWYFIPIVGVCLAIYDISKTMERDPKALAEECTRLNKLYGDRATFTVQTQQVVCVMGHHYTHNGMGSNLRTVPKYSIIVYPKDVTA